MIIKASKNYVLRNVVDEYILLPIGEKQKEFQGGIRINEVSAFVWRIVLEGEEFEAVLEQILSEYAVDRHTAEEDLKNLINQFVELGVIESFSCN